MVDPYYYILRPYNDAVKTFYNESSVIIKKVWIFYYIIYMYKYIYI
jgi:hypothetical protein